jgi:hypothetical protein
VLGRFALGLLANDAAAVGRLQFNLTLYGSSPDEQTEQITVTRGPQAALLTLAPDRTRRAVLPSACAGFVIHVAQGAHQVLSGPDHLLFLLVVLATGWRLRQALLALTCFTAGHAITLAASALGAVAVPASLVEPAIAATIVGMALFDRLERQRAQRSQASPAYVRLGLVFACALIHGLGLAGAQTDLGLDRTHQLISLAGFNLGIELGQLAAALATVGVLGAVQARRGRSGLALATRRASYTAVGAGLVWFVERVAAAAAA